MGETLEAPLRGANVTAPSEATVADVFDRAADLLGEQGWTKGSRGLPWGKWLAGRRPLGQLCYLGSVAQAALDLGIQKPDGCSWYEWTGTLVGENHRAAYGWNDSPGRTKAEVVTRLRQKASRAREGATESERS